MDVDASLVEIHSERKQGATPHFKRGFGFHPMFCFLDATGEALAGVLRPGNAAANSGADQLADAEMAIAQLPAEHQQGHRPGDTVVGGIGVLGAILSRLQGFPVTPENKHEFLWIDRMRGRLALGLWPLWALMLSVGAVLLLLGY